MNENSSVTDDRIQRIIDLIIKFNMGEFHLRETISENDDEIDAIIIGLNSLGEVVESSKRIINNYEYRLEKINAALLQYALQDFSKKLDVGEQGDDLDAIAIGLNTLAEELEYQILQLRSSNKELEAFTYSVSHDLRAPLRAIHSYAHIIASEHSGALNSEAKTMLQAVITNAKKMGQLIDDLLGLSKLGRAKLNPQLTNMESLINESIDEVSKSVAMDNVSFNLGKMTNCKLDRNLMKQVWINLISNAIKYSSLKSNPTIWIGSYKEGSEVVYYVRDNGTGFSMKYYDKLFGVFQRLHGADEFEGTGVGLALVKRIIDRHNGRVWAEGVIDNGATFFFALKK